MDRWTDGQTVQDWAQSLENLDLEHTGLLQGVEGREWEQKGSHFLWGVSGVSSCLTPARVLTSKGITQMGVCSARRENTMCASFITQSNSPASFTESPCEGEK